MNNNFYFNFSNQNFTLNIKFSTFSKKDFISHASSLSSIPAQEFNETLKMNHPLHFYSNEGDSCFAFYGVHSQLIYFFSFSIVDLPNNDNSWPLNNFYNSFNILFNEFITQLYSQITNERDVEFIHMEFENNNYNLVCDQYYNIAKCVKYIETHITDNIKIAHLINISSLSYGYLEKVFSRIMHVTIKQFILLEKIRLAKEYLIQNVKSIKEIAYDLCFSSISHFGRVFKKIMHQTPNSYRLYILAINSRYSQ